MPEPRPTASDEQLVDGIATVTFALKFVQPLKARYELSGTPGELGSCGPPNPAEPSLNASTPSSSAPLTSSTADCVTELTRIVCGSAGWLLCCAASSAAETTIVVPWR
jgi:hypothetical protein